MQVVQCVCKGVCVVWVMPAELMKAPLGFFQQAPSGAAVGVLNRWLTRLGDASCPGLPFQLVAGDCQPHGTYLTRMRSRP